jgi:hypothetical protein
LVAYSVRFSEIGRQQVSNCSRGKIFAAANGGDATGIRIPSDFND